MIDQTLVEMLTERRWLRGLHQQLQQEEGQRIDGDPSKVYLYSNSTGNMLLPMDNL